MYGRSEKIGIFGGSFNPIHNGHLMIAGAAAETFKLDQVLFVPNPNPPHKAGAEMPPGEIRAQMTAKAIAGYADYGLSTYELRRGYDCYTCNTLMHFREKYPEDELYFIMGADSLETFHTWKNPAVIASLAILCVSCRDDLYADEFEAIAQEVRARYHADVRMIPCEGMEVSSTRIRELVCSGKRIDHLVPAAVAQMIKEQKLYLPKEQPFAE